jgi:hypothetical protein
VVPGVRGPRQRNGGAVHRRSPGRQARGPRHRDRGKPTDDLRPPRDEIEDRETVYEYRPYGQFTRSFTLPENVDVQHTTSDLRDGVLYVVVPKTAGARARKIAIGGVNPKS